MPIKANVSEFQDIMPSLTPANYATTFAYVVIKIKQLKMKCDANDSKFLARFMT